MKKMPIAICTLLLVAALSACGEEAPEEAAAEETPTVTPCIDITAVARQSQNAVSTELGEPVTSEPSGFAANAVSCTYEDGTEVLYIDDVAGRITVYPPAGTAVEDGAAVIGLTEEQAGTASYDASENFYWKDNTEYAEITAFNDGDQTISYIYVITDEAYR